MQHLDEGTIHTWLDGELSPEEAAKVEAHANECSQCAAHVAEARGLIAASTRILTSLDDVPSGVLPSTPAAEPVTSIPQVVRVRRWYDRTDIRAAAAVLLVAGASLVIAKSQRNPKAAVESAAIATDRSASLAAPMESSAASSPVNAEKLQANESHEERAQTQGTAAPGPRPEPSKKAVAAISGPGVLGASSRDEAAGNRFAQPPSTVAQAAPAPSSPRVAAPQPMSKTLDAPAAVSVMADAVKQTVRGRVEGRITSDRGSGMAGATVTVQGTNLGATTDTSGKFRLENVPAGEQRLVVRRIGYEAKTVPVSVNDSVTVPTLALQPSVASLSDMVVTGTAAATERMSLEGAARVSGIRRVRADTTGTTNQEVYEVSPGVQVTLVETVDATDESDLANQRAKKAVDSRESAPQAASAPALPRAPTNTIAWREGNRRYSLTGPLSIRQLEAIKAELMKTRR